MKMKKLVFTLVSCFLAGLLSTSVYASEHETQGMADTATMECKENCEGMDENKCKCETSEDGKTCCKEHEMKDGADDMNNGEEKAADDGAEKSDDHGGDNNADDGGDNNMQ